MTQDGERSIEQVQLGDMVLAKNPDTGEMAYKEVDMLFQRPETEIWKVTVGDEVISTSDEHPFWIKGKGWVVTKNLVMGDLFETSDGSHLSIDKIEVTQENTTVFNFRVKDFHTYYVSNLKILTHNSGESCLPASTYLIRVKNSKTVDYSFYPNLDRIKDGPRILRLELERVGIEAPYDPRIKSFAAHHIVANGDTRPDAERARFLLERFGIDTNSAANGVYLPMYPGYQYINDNGKMIATHNGRHSPDYLRLVVTELESAYENFGANPERGVEALNNIRHKLNTGQAFLQMSGGTLILD